MRVLFLSVTAGQGHNQTAKAAMEALSGRVSELAMIDTFEYINPVLSESIAKGYLISTKFTPKVYGRIYRMAESIEKNNAKISLSKLISSILSKKLIAVLRQYDMDIIVCTHIFSAQIVSYMQASGLIKAKTIGIVTDFTIHPFWEDTCLDYYITASPQLAYQAMKKGIDCGKVKASGIPIFKKFSLKSEKSVIRNSLGLNNAFTILVMSGSMGYGNVTDTIRQINNLDMDVQIISVCGSNKALKKRIDNMQIGKKILNFGYVNNVDELMDASDCIITKPGGLTVSESMAKCLPMLIVNPIPGQEDRNAEFLLNNGLAIKISDRFPVDEAIWQLVNDKSRIANIKNMMLNVGRPNASEDLAQLILKL